MARRRFWIAETSPQAPVQQEGYLGSNRQPPRRVGWSVGLPPARRGRLPVARRSHVGADLRSDGVLCRRVVDAACGPAVDHADRRYFQSSGGSPRPVVTWVRLPPYGKQVARSGSRNWPDHGALVARPDSLSV